MLVFNNLKLISSISIQLSTSLIAYTLIFIIPCFASAQYTLDVHVNDNHNPCEFIVFDLEIVADGQNSNTNGNLELTFNHDIKYEESSSNLSVTKVSNRILSVELSGEQECEFISASLSVLPVCLTKLMHLETKFKLIANDECLAEDISSTLIKTPFLSVQFGDYIPNASRDQVSKTIQIKNIGLSAIQDLNIVPNIVGDFARINSIAGGMLNDGMISIGPSDFNAAGLPSSNLPIQESFELTIVYDILKCEAKQINYSFIFPCADQVCETELSYVDDNISNNIAIGLEQDELLYGICGPQYNEVKIQNTSKVGLQESAVLYDVKYILNSYTINYQSTINDCFSPTVLVEGNPATTEIRDDSIIFSFSNFDFDPDGVGGLNDLDGDGIYNDLPSGEEVNIKIGFQVREGCTDNYYNQAYSIFASTSTRNICGGENPIPDNENRYQFSNSISSRIQALEFTNDASNGRYFEEGQNLEFRYTINYSNNLSQVCDSDELILELSIPSNLTLDNSEEIYHFIGEDTVFIEPQSIDINSLIFSITELNASSSTLVIPFIAICNLEENSNYDSTQDICEQCLEYDLDRFYTKLTKPCAQLPCDIPIPTPDPISPDFYTACNEIPIAENGLVVDIPQYYRLPTGWSDESASIRRNPYDYPSDINNRTVFDHDTLLMRIPFKFNCPGSERDFRINLNFGTLNFMEIENISAEVYKILPSNPTDTSNCNMINQMVWLGNRLQFDITRNMYPDGCIALDAKHWLDLKLLIKYTCNKGNNCGLAARRIWTISMDEVYNNTCTRVKRISRDTIYINELYKEEFGGHNVFFPIQNYIYDEFSLSLDLYKTLTRGENRIVEYRYLPIVRELTYTIPVGYEVISDFQIIADRFSSSTGGLNVNENDIELIKSLNPIINSNPDGSTNYTYTDEETGFYTELITSNIYSNLKIKSVCEPTSTFNRIHVNAKIEYVDYASGSRETRIHNYEEDIPITFNYKEYTSKDIFQTKTSDSTIIWDIDNNSFLNPFRFGIDAKNIIEEEIFYTLKYSSNGSSIDSLIITPQEANTPNDSIIPHSQLDDFTFEIYPQVSPIFVGSDSLYLLPPILDYTFNTSNHPCGFDTLIYEIGVTKEFMDDNCLPNIFTDTLITFSPPGLAIIDIDSIPSAINYDQENTLSWTISNLGQGDLELTSITLDQMPDADYTLQLIDANNTSTDITSFLLYDEGSLQINFENGIEMNGINNELISANKFVLHFTDICSASQFLNGRISAQTESHCGDITSTNTYVLDKIPYTSSTDISFDIEQSSFVDDLYENQFGVEFQFNSSMNGQLSDASLEIYIPKSLSYLNNTLLLNGNSIDEPAQDASEGYKILIINNLNISDADILELKLDLACTDRCSMSEIFSFLSTNEPSSCNSLNGKRYKINGNSGRDELPHSPNLEMLNSDITSFNQVGEMIELNSVIELLLSGSEDRSDLAVASYYLDLNHNDSLDIEDLLIDEVKRDDWEISDSTITISKDLIISPSNICDLSISISTPASCLSSLINSSFSLGEMISLEHTIYQCGQDTLKIPLTQYATCNTQLRNYRNEFVVNDTLLYKTLNEVQQDIIYRDITCGTCQIVEVYNISYRSQDIDIHLVENTCNTSAGVTWTDGTKIPSNYTFQWNNNNNLTTNKIEDLIPGSLVTLLLDDNLGCIYRDSISLQEPEEIEYDINLNLACDVDSFDNVSIVIDDIFNYDIKWNDDNNNFVRNHLNEGIYKFTITDNNNCIISDSVIIKQPTPIEIMLDSNITEAAGTIINLNQDEINDPTWLWTWESESLLSCYDCPSPSLELDETTEVVYIISNGECSLKNTIDITAIYSDEIYIPNIFTPSGVNNKRFVISPNSSFDEYEIQIFDRWGNMLYDEVVNDWKDQDIGWDGRFRSKEVLPGIYIYKLSVSRNIDNVTKDFFGDFLLIR